MVEKDVIIKEKVKYAGIGNFKDAYKYAHDWLRESGFSITEENYSEKISGNSKDIEIVWRGSRKLTDYFRMALDVKWRVLGMSDVEVEIDGKKKNMNKFVDLSIDLKGTLEKDYSNKWEPNATHKVLKEMYHKYVIPNRTDEKAGQVIETIQGFKEEMKAFFDLTARRT